jgi:uncharacterized membrane protein YphA (DoxX/SURF4 family)
MVWWSDPGPGWVIDVLSWHGTWFAARVCLCSAYLFAGVTKLLNFRGATSEQIHFGLHPGWLWAAVAVVVELVAPIMVICNQLVWFAAGSLCVLTGIAVVVLAADARSLRGDARIMAVGGLFERIGLIAGFVLVAILGSRG